MPLKINLTKRVVDDLEPPATGRTYLYDRGQSNLALCVTSNGVKTWYRTGRVEGRPKRIRIGKWPDISVEAARNAARSVAGDIAKGVDPTRKRSDPATVQALFDRWLIHAKPRKRTWQADEKLWDSCMGRLRTKRLTDLTPATVADWHTKLGQDRGTVLANRARALLSSIFSKAHELGHNEPNPCASVERFPEQSRERFLQQEEMRPFLLAVKAEPADWRDFWLLCLFTGARRGNVASMAWSELDLVAGLWHIPASKTKNKKPGVVVLPAPAVQVLKARHESKGESPCVFPSDSDDGHIKDPRKSWARVIAAAGIDDLHPHDLRRSLGSWQANQGTSLHIIGKSLGHVDPRSTMVYSRLQVEPVRASVDSAVVAMIEAGEPAKPVKKTRATKGTTKTRKRKAAGNGKAK